MKTEFECLRPYRALLGEFLLTLGDEQKHEWWGTDRSIYDKVIREFFDWVEAREKDSVPVVGKPGLAEIMHLAIDFADKFATFVIEEDQAVRQFDIDAAERAKDRARSALLEALRKALG